MVITIYNWTVVETNSFVFMDKRILNRVFLWSKEVLRIWFHITLNLNNVFSLKHNPHGIFNMFNMALDKQQYNNNNVGQFLSTLKNAKYTQKTQKWCISILASVCRRAGIRCENYILGWGAVIFFLESCILHAYQRL